MQERGAALAPAEGAGSHDRSGRWAGIPPTMHSTRRAGERSPGTPGTIRRRGTRPTPLNSQAKGQRERHRSSSSRHCAGSGGGRAWPAPPRPEPAPCCCPSST
ncbi:hypothetical protein G6F65_020404 [Rhizopus arrhizus]|uniref:Uncharacterized protein n=1 Tax=Rhizopus delemar TaxID=936053 RepID=A0A9P6XQ37_9FUNG|nr:hypothetical protein G6F24_017037 [Rhizopus arrhizus]KAG1246974.1 hypothetical protein G6F65_020404 [Rhizopus arrhizus]KAG1529751.1 hypothetical protein G6F50_017783 [Rhizopus delemar]